ncbi:MAG: diaminopimelate epimerase [Chlamydiia bacterium]|nr:diaminopimelate epimerase [Chlamydiia bacterium]
MQFWKLTGCGNDFILFDCWDQDFSKEIIPHIPHFCHRKRGIGADGVIFALPDQMRLFNCDGSEAEMCGNGIRCLGRFLSSKGRGKAWTIKTLAGPIEVSVDRDISLRFTHQPQVTLKPWFHCNTGVPHVVYPVEDIKGTDVATLGLKIAHDPHFPNGTNVNFVQVVSANRLFVRTFERGVNAETEACGTGALAAGLYALETKKGKVPLDVIFSSGDTLRVSVEKKDPCCFIFQQWGQAELLFQGEITIDG